MRRVPGLATLSLSLSLVATSGGCGPSLDAGEGDGDEGSIHYEGELPETGCTGRLEPVEPAGTLHSVGDGSPASCTEDALRNAVSAATDGDGVVLNCGKQHTIELTQPLRVATSIVLDGGGTTALSGGGTVRVIELDQHLDFVLQRITIRNGFVAAGSAKEGGAGLWSQFGTLEVIDSRFENDHSQSQGYSPGQSQDPHEGGGAIHASGLTRQVISGSMFLGNSATRGGGILSHDSNLRVVDSIFFENSATTDGPGSSHDRFGFGGGLFVDQMSADGATDLAICGAVFERNHATIRGSAVFSDESAATRAVFARATFANNTAASATVHHEGVPIVVTSSTFSGNESARNVGGLAVVGDTSATIENVTFANNSAGYIAGGLWAEHGEVDVRNVTFTHNRAVYGPAAYAEGFHVTVTNTVFDNNVTDSTQSHSCHGSFDGDGSGGGSGNVQWPDTRNNGNPDRPCVGGVTFADPMVDDLADNGGPTKTAALQAGSPAIGVGASCPDADQRGEPRGVQCDAGAFERQD